MKYIRGFDGLRAISITMVILTHLGLQGMLAQYPSLLKHYNLFSGLTGVIIFFTISGYLITTLLLVEKKQHGKINLRFFFIRRFLRLLPPLLIFYVAIVLLMMFHFLPGDYHALLMSFFYVYNFVPLFHYVSELGHTWSLAVEEQFYFFWPFVIYYTRSFKAVLLVALAVIACCIVVTSIYHLPVMYKGKPRLLTDYFFVERWFVPACMPIMTGAAAAIVMQRYHTTVNKLLQKNYWMLLLILILYFAQLIMSGLPARLIAILQPISIALLLVWICCNQVSEFVAILEWRPVAFIGKISYGIYVYQGLFLRTGPGGSLTIQQFPLNVLLVFTCAVLSYYCIEKKCMRLKDRFKPERALDVNTTAVPSK